MTMGRLEHTATVCVILMVISCNYHQLVAGVPCPCQDESLCQPVAPSPHRKEVFIFSLSKTNWHMYDWDKITTIVMVGYYNPDLVCFAHSKQARAVAIASIATDDLLNATKRQEWVEDKVTYVQANFIDGINVDFENPIPKGNVSLRDGYTSLIKGLYRRLKIINVNYQITVDTAWRPDCVDGRCYDIKGLALNTDFLFVMSYDERSQIFYDCIAWANSAFNNTYYGIQQYLKIPGIKRNKLVLGVPWYGYHYPCVRLVGETCFLEKVPFRGVNCSDAAGREYNSNTIRDLLMYNTTSKKPKWDTIAQSPYFTYYDSTTGKPYQIWYDNADSLTLKYKMAANLGLRGVGMWNSDALDYTNTTAGQMQRKEMWGALPDYKTSNSVH